MYAPKTSSSGRGLPGSKRRLEDGGALDGEVRERDWVVYSLAAYGTGAASLLSWHIPRASCAPLSLRLLLTSLC